MEYDCPVSSGSYRGAWSCYRCRNWLAWEGRRREDYDDEVDDSVDHEDDADEDGENEDGENENSGGNVVPLDKGDHGADMEDAKEDDVIDDMTLDNIEDPAKKNNNEL